MLTVSSVSRLFKAFNKLNVLVIGDVMVDAYLIGDVDRISPEAPVPIVNVNVRQNRLGGAANVGLNVNALGANTILCSVIGHDQKGSDFLDLLEEQKMSKVGIIQSDDRITTTKFRVIGNNTQLLRVDDEQTSDLLDDEKQQLYYRLKEITDAVDIHVIIFQDYDKGIIHPELIADVVHIAKNKGIPVVVDPKKKNFMSYLNVDLFKPNLKEIKEGLNMSFDTSDENALKEAVGVLQDSINADIILTTLAEKGVVMRTKGEEGFDIHHIPAHIRNIADVSGAGDTVISVAALCLAMGIDPHDMAAISNLAGGLVCEEVGVVPIDKSRLQDEVNRILTQ